MGTASSGQSSSSNVRKRPMKKISRIPDVPKKNQITNIFKACFSACFNDSVRSQAVTMQHALLGTSPHLIVGDTIVRVLQNMRTSWIAKVFAFGGATSVQLYRTVELMNPGKIADVMCLVGTSNMTQILEAEEGRWEKTLLR